MSSIPYLIQRCTVKDVFIETQKVSEYLSLDYMGSSEYEWGAVPKCLREFNNRLDELVTTRLEVLGRDGITRVVHLLSLTCQVVIWEQFFKECANASSAYSGPRLKEGISLTKILGGYLGEVYQRDNFWIDIDNCVAMCQELGPLENFKKAVVNSVKFMNEQKKKESKA